VKTVYKRPLTRLWVSLLCLDAHWPTWTYEYSANKQLTSAGVTSTVPGIEY